MSRPVTDVWHRFWGKVRKTDGCWEWTGPTSENGYGRVFLRKVDRKNKWQQAHRYSWEWHVGPVPAGKYVLHSCDNRLCVNPDHLRIGTHKDNMKDRNKKLRQALGERHGLAKLTDDAVRRLRIEHRAGKSIYQMGRETGINESTLSRAIRGKTWKHVTE